MIISDIKYWKYFDNISDAQIYINIFTIDGYNNWRVPTVAEYGIIQHNYKDEIEKYFYNINGGIIVFKENLDLILQLPNSFKFQQHLVIPVRHE